MDATRLKHFVEKAPFLPLLIQNPIDLFYLTGHRLSLGKLLVFPDHCELFVDGRYFEAMKQNSMCPVFPLSEFEKRAALEKQIGFESHFLSYEESLRLFESIPSCEWKPISRPTKQARLVKEPREIEAIRKAAHLTYLGYEHLVGLLQEGVREEEIAWEFEKFCRERGASGLSFPPIVAFQENGAYPHHRSSKRKLKSSDTVLLDLGAIVDGYCADMTRCVAVGKKDPVWESDYALLQEVTHQVIQEMREGICFGELEKRAREILSSHGKESFFVHSLSHGVGLEVHEPPFRLDRDLKLQAGMVLTIEPGIYRPPHGGCRYEELVLIGEKGAERLI